MQKITDRTRRLSGERGAGLVEYGLLVALIAVVCIVAVTFVGTSGSGKINQAGNGLNSGQNTAGSTTPPGTCTDIDYNGAPGHQVVQGYTTNWGPGTCASLGY